MKLEDFYWIGNVDVGSFVYVRLKKTTLLNPTKTLGVDPTKVYFFKDRTLYLEPTYTDKAKHIIKTRTKISKENIALLIKPLEDEMDKARTIHLNQQKMELTERDKKMIELYNQGVSNKDIATQVNLTVSSVNTRLCFLRKEGFIQKRSKNDDVYVIGSKQDTQNNSSKESAQSHLFHKRVVNAFIVAFMDIGVDFTQEKFMKLANKFSEELISEIK